MQDSQRIAIKTFVVVEDPSGPVESLAWDKYQQASREARVISKLVHDNILGLVGVAIAPLMLLLELAPLGDLKVCVEKFQQAKVRLNVLTLSSTLIQVRFQISNAGTNARHILQWRRFNNELASVQTGRKSSSPCALETVYLSGPKAREHTGVEISTP